MQPSLDRQEPPCLLVVLTLLIEQTIANRPKPGPHGSSCARVSWHLNNSLLQPHAPVQLLTDDWSHTSSLRRMQIKACTVTRHPSCARAPSTLHTDNRSIWVPIKPLQTKA
jgi:hypothetical protein